MGFTHVEFLPVAEHAFYPSWGYQVTGFYAPDQPLRHAGRFSIPGQRPARGGHRRHRRLGAGPFPARRLGAGPFRRHRPLRARGPAQRRAPGLGHAHLQLRPARGRAISSLANALFWCDRFHIDGLRVDAVASMLYLDYSRKEGEWIPNQYGGRENLEAIEFLRHFNHLDPHRIPGRDDHCRGIHRLAAGHPAALPRRTRLLLQMEHGLDARHAATISAATPSTANITRTTSPSRCSIITTRISSCRSRTMKWCMAKARCWAACPATTGSGSPICAPCSATSGCSRARTCCSWAANSARATNGTPTAELDWWLLEAGPYHLRLQRFVADLNRSTWRHPALWQADYDHAGFYWIDCSDQREQHPLLRPAGLQGSTRLVVILNLTPVPRPHYRVGLPRPGHWREVLNSDAAIYGGSNVGNLGGVRADPSAAQPALLRRIHLAAAERDRSGMDDLLKSGKRKAKSGKREMAGVGVTTF